MNVKVLSRMEAQNYCKHVHDESCVIISITDTDLEDADLFCHEQNGVKDIFRVKFDDWDDQDELYRDDPQYADLIKTIKVIDEEQAEDIVCFVDSWVAKVDFILVHCEAGISRSAGTAAAILKAYDGDDSSIFDSKFFYPNRLVYRKVLNAFAKIFPQLF